VSLAQKGGETLNCLFGNRCCNCYTPCPPRPTCSATVTVGSTTTLEAGSPAYVTNTGTLQNAILNFGIPQGPVGPQGIPGPQGTPGATGPQGPAGEDGAAATITIGTVTALAPGTTPTVNNVGTSTAAILNFGIPSGAQGATGPQGPAGEDGAAATIAIGTVTALEPGVTPTVENVGTPTAAILNFGIPTVTQGAAVLDLAATATEAEIIAKINELLAALRTTGIIAE